MKLIINNQSAFEVWNKFLKHETENIIQTQDNMYYYTSMFLLTNSMYVFIYVCIIQL